jgi:hypothetical protein
MPLTTYTAGEVLTAASLNANFTFAAANPAGGLTLIATATPTAVASVSINNCFTSTYQNYRIVVNVTAATGGNAAVTLRLRASATDTTTNYTSQLQEAYSTTVSTVLNTSGTDDWYISNLDGTYDNLSFAYDIYAPQTATTTRYNGQSIYNTSVMILQTVGGLQTASTQFDGFTLLYAGTDFTGTIRVYGYANS